MSQYIIIGDLGGTKCAFSFFELSSTNKISSLGMEPVVLPIRSYASFCELMEAANEQLPTTRKIEGASGVCIGAAGVWDSNTQNIYLEHYWNGAADIGEMLSRFSVAPEKVLILNDFEAEAHCLLTSIVDKRKIIRQGHGTYPTERFLLIGPGTGLGVAVIDRDGSLRRTESGHTPIAYPLRKETRAYWPAFMEHFERHRIAPTWEHFLSGNGLSLIHQIATSQSLSPSKVSALIKEGRADDTRDIFAELLGMKCRSVAYSHWYPNEIYLSGGVLKKTPQILESPYFVEAFETFAQHGHVLDTVSISLLEDPYTSLYGAAQAFSLLAE